MCLLSAAGGTNRSLGEAISDAPRCGSADREGKGESGIAHLGDDVKRQGGLPSFAGNKIEIYLVRTD